MNVNLLIDMVVRQTIVFIAQLATAPGNRASLAHVADRVFGELVAELRKAHVGEHAPVSKRRILECRLGRPATGRTRVTFYFGQMVQGDETGERGRES